MTDRLGLPPRYRKQLEGLLREHVPGVEVWAYGSRVNGRGHEGSDLDLVLRSPTLEPLGGGFYDLLEAIEKSSIPILVQAHDWAKLPESFHREIEKDYVVVQKGVKGQSASVDGEWRKMPLGECAVLIRDTVAPSDLADTPYIGLEHIGEGNLSLVGHGMASDVTSTKTRFQRGDILFGKLRPYFRKVVRSSFNGICSTDIWVVRAKEGVEQRFLYYCMASPSFVDFVSSGSEGTRMPRAKWDYATQYKISLPPLSEQRAIAHVLGTLDDKIEINRRMNETLEAMTRAMFRDWFVNSGPTRAKAEGCDPYLAPEIWNLFPATLDDEGKPVGWGRGILAQIAESPRRSISPADISEDTPYIGLKHMPRRSISLTEWEGSDKVLSNKSVFKRGEFLFGKLMPCFHKVGFAPLDGICSTDIVVVTPREPHWSAFTLACLSSDDFVNYTDQTSTGTTMPRTNWKTMAQYNIIHPPEQIADVFQNTVQPLLNRVVANAHENRTLTALRDALLPRLMSGEVWVEKLKIVG